jgi:murein lipoprotein
MTTLTENDLKELKGFLKEQFQQINDKTDKLSEDFNNKIDKVSEDLNNKIDKVSEEVNGKIDKLSEEVNNLRVDFANAKGELTGINKRLDNLEFTNRTIFVAIVTALLAGVVKLFFPNLPNTP